MSGEQSGKPRRTLIDVEPARLLAALPAMGRLMVTSSLLGVTHERIGAVDMVVAGGSVVTLGGAAHDSRIETSAIAAMLVDRSGRMGDKAYPRVDFHSADREVIFSVVGFDGLEPFDAALAPFGAGAAVDAEPDRPAGERGEVGDADPGAEPFDEAMERGVETVIGFRRPSFEQRWQGRVEAVRPAMGFINVMRPDFHLHLKAGGVGSWRRDGNERVAAGVDGRPLGLFVAFPS